MECTKLQKIFDICKCFYMIFENIFIFCIYNNILYFCAFITNNVFMKTNPVQYSIDRNLFGTQVRSLPQK